MKRSWSAVLALSVAVLAAVMDIHAQGASKKRSTVSVLYFENTAKNTEYGWLSKGIADMLITDLAAGGAVDVVERSSLNRVLREQELALTGIIDESKAVKLGKLMSAQKLIYGSFIIQGKTIVINGRLTDTSTGKIENTFSVKGPVDRVLYLQADFSAGALKSLGINAPVSLRTETARPVEAVKIYYLGLDLLDRGAVEDARRKFEEASRIDPYYLKPYQGIEESYRFLKDFTRMRQQREIALLYDRIDRINRRLKENPWRTFADIAMDPGWNRLRHENSALYEKEVYAYYQGDSPAVLTWNLQNNLSELAGKYEEYFNDSGRARRLQGEIISITEKSRSVFANDSFMPEILYQALLASSCLEDWPSVKSRSEELMMKYPDYRMMWAVEDFYKSALEKLSGEKNRK